LGYYALHQRSKYVLIPEWPLQPSILPDYKFI